MACVCMHAHACVCVCVCVCARVHACVSVLCGVSTVLKEAIELMH